MVRSPAWRRTSEEGRGRRKGEEGEGEEGEAGVRLWVSERRRKRVGIVS